MTRWLVLAAVAVAAAAAGFAVAARGERDADRQAQVAARGANVMPFDLERTTHVFQPTTDGGVQTVRADDPNDDEQIALIRAHLREEAAAFARGDFTDPAFIHGPDMPGLAELREGASRIDVEFQTLPEGARIRYVSDDPSLVHALHVWFEAQASDHGEHAEHP